MKALLGGVALLLVCACGGEPSTLGGGTGGGGTGGGSVFGAGGGAAAGGGSTSGMGGGSANMGTGGGSATGGGSTSGVGGGVATGGCSQSGTGGSGPGTAMKTGIEGFCEHYKKCGGTTYATAQDCVDDSLAYWGSCATRRAAQDAFGNCMLGLTCQQWGNPNAYNPANTPCASQWSALLQSTPCP